jgi:hypothetical protein
MDTIRTNRGGTLGRNPQGATTAQRVAEMVKSEGQFVMSCIEVQTLPQPEKVQTYQWCFIV